MFEVLTRLENRERQTMGSRFEHPATITLLIWPTAFFHY